MTSGLLLCLAIATTAAAPLPGPSAGPQAPLPRAQAAVAPLPPSAGAPLGPAAPRPAAVSFVAPASGTMPPAAQPTSSANVAEASFAARLAELERQIADLSNADQKEKAAAEETPTLKFTMQLQADAYAFGQDAASIASVGDIQDGSAFRRARIGWQGDYGVTEYRIEFDFALSGRPTLLDVWAGLKDLPLLNQFRVGHFFEPFSLERVTSNRFMTFMERGLVDSAFVPARNLGIITNQWTDDERATWALGLFRTNSDVFGDDVGDKGEKAVTTRVTWLPYYDDPSGGRYYLHVGGSYSYRDADNDEARFATQPEARLGSAVPNVPFFVDTGIFPARSWQLLGVETVWNTGPFSLQAEAVATPVNRLAGEDVTFYGYYAYATYFLTGEHRPYRKRYGILDRVHPFENFFRVATDGGIRTGLGAWQVAVRVSHVDLNQADILGGRLTDLTVGLNWYLTPYLRMTSNWVHAFLDDPTVGDSNTDIYGIRVGYEF